MQDELKKLNKRLERLSARKENEVARVYAAVLRELRRQLSDIYAKHEVDGKLTWEVMTKHNRLTKFEDEVRKKLMAMNNEIKLLTYNHLKDVYQESYYNTAYLIEKESQAKLAYSAVKPEVIEKSIQNNFTGLTLNERLNKNRNDLIIKMREEITRGLHEGKTYKQMTDAIKGSLENDVKKARTIVRTESHRMRESSSYEAARHANAQGVKMVKVWNTVQDERVRDGTKSNADHDSMEGKKIDVDEEFVLPSGARGESPGNTGVSSEDINCRCFTTYEVVAIEKPQHDELENISYSEWRKTRVS